MIDMNEVQRYRIRKSSVWNVNIKNSWMNDNQLYGFSMSHEWIVKVICMNVNFRTGSQHRYTRLKSDLQSQIKEHVPAQHSMTHIWCRRFASNRAENRCVHMFCLRDTQRWCMLLLSDIDASNSFDGAYWNTQIWSRDVLPMPLMARTETLNFDHVMSFPLYKSLTVSKGTAFRDTTVTF